MQWDIDLCNQENGEQARVQSSNLNEQLGQIDYIFSDKTGTLTKNYMEFKKVSIGDYHYGLDCGLSGRENEPDFERDVTGGLLDSVERLSTGSVVNEYNTVDHFNFYDPEFE